MAYKKDRKKYWKKHLKNWKKSGLSQTQYCKDNNILPNLFSKWKNSLKESTNQKGGLIELPIQITSTESSKIEIIYKNSYTIRCNNLSELSQIIKSLEILNAP